MFLGCGFASVSLSSSFLSSLSLVLSWEIGPGAAQAALACRSFITVALPLGGQIYQTLRFGLRMRPPCTLPSRWTTSFDVTRLKTERRIGASSASPAPRVRKYFEFARSFVRLCEAMSQRPFQQAQSIFVTVSPLSKRIGH